MVKQARWSMLWVFFSLGCAGCNKGTDHPPVYAVTGAVTYRGAPVAGANVVFRPVGEGRGAVGETDKDGQFKLTTYDANDGASAGDYIVVVQKTGGESEWTQKINEMNPKSTLEYEDWLLKNKVPRDFGVKTLRHLPQKYAQAELSPLRATVTAAGPNDFSFALKD